MLIEMPNGDWFDPAEVTSVTYFGQGSDWTVQVSLRNAETYPVVETADRKSANAAAREVALAINVALSAVEP